MFRAKLYLYRNVLALSRDRRNVARDSDSMQDDEASQALADNEVGFLQKGVVMYIRISTYGFDTENVRILIDLIRLSVTGAANQVLSKSGMNEESAHKKAIRNPEDNVKNEIKQYFETKQRLDCFRATCPFRSLSHKCVSSQSSDVHSSNLYPERTYTVFT